MVHWPLSNVAGQQGVLMLNFSKLQESHQLQATVPDMYKKFNVQSIEMLATALVHRGIVRAQLLYR